MWFELSRIGKFITFISIGYFTFLTQTNTLPWRLLNTNHWGFQLNHGASRQTREILRQTHGAYGKSPWLMQKPMALVENHVRFYVKPTALMEKNMEHTRCWSQNRAPWRSAVRFRRFGRSFPQSAGGHHVRPARPGARGAGHRVFHASGIVASEGPPFGSKIRCEGS